MATLQTQAPTVIIIGAGLAGLSLALGIAKIGSYKVVVVEKRNEFTEQGASFSLAPNGAKALRDLGLHDLVQDMEALGTPIDRVSYPIKPLLLIWWALRDALLSRAKESDSIAIHTGLEIKSIVDTPSAEKARVEFMNSDLVLEGELVVGADGVHSAVREILKRKPAINKGRKIYYGHVDASEQNNSKLGHLLTKGTQALLITDPCVFVVFSFQSNTSSRLAWVNIAPDHLAADINSPLESLQLYEGHVDEETWKTLQAFQEETIPDHTFASTVRVQDLSDEVLSSYESGWGGKGRVTLVGDAAHAIRSASGLGGSMAFEDAIALCRILRQSHVVKQIIEYDFCAKQVVAAFENERLPRVKKISEDQELRAESVHDKSKVIEPWTQDFMAWIYEGV